ncbi:MAG: BREX-1 system adenine-specific DNA-methyltransferase PglX, partial [Bacteroidales bacterium]|nr:BREX-1 system adenine-specific DNA-methyltransferase PglX [Bacteroidales bacterium]
MNTNQIQRFATQARNILLAGVNAKLNLLGFNADGSDNNVTPPSRYSDSTVFQGRVIPGTRFYEQWMELYNRIKLIGFDDVCEEAAYTWFNRLVALRILQKNGIIQPVIEYDNPAVKVPRIVNDARRGKYDFLMPSDRQQLNEVIDDDTRLFEQFQILITAYCHNHPILKACFGGITGYTELLLPNNILVDGNFIDLLNNTDYLTDDDYRQSELIGWLYQFYISEKKDEVFASFKDGNKAEADQIPAATQIFTPNWIVKYMVQNTAGRIYLDNHPNSPIKDSWKYLVEAPEPVEGSPSERGQGGVLQLSSLEDLTCADFSCGSGHILGEFFDLLYQIYDDELYDPRDAVEKILTHNILGIDLDTRAKQLSMFALLLKACQKDISFADAHCLPRVLDMPNCNRYTWLDLEGHMVTALQIKSGNAKIAKELEECFLLLEQARNLGSIMKFTVSPETRAFMQDCLAQQAIQQKYVEDFKPLFDGFKLILALTDKYTAVVMNPPYMGGNNMNAELAKYAKDNYEDEKSDLFAIFMNVAENHLLPKAKYGMINMHSWMFLSSFEKLRTHIIDDLQIDNMLHLGPRTFDEIGGEVVQNTAYVITNAKPTISGYYFRLVDFAPSDSKKVNFLNCCRHIRVNGDISKMRINLSPYCFNVNQSNFKKILGNPVFYYITENLLKAFTTNESLGKLYKTITGSSTGQNATFIRNWQEVDIRKIGLKLDETYTGFGYKWIPCVKGGSYRKWYGNLYYLINWDKDGEELKAFATYKNNGKHWSRFLKSLDCFYKSGVTWAKVLSGKFSSRYMPEGCIMESAGCAIMPGKKDEMYLLALMNSIYVQKILEMINPTMNMQAGDIMAIPIKYQENTKEKINELANGCLNISKQDWNAHETSWDFQENELIRIFKGIRENPFSEASYSNDTEVTLETTVEAYKREWESKFLELHKNEEELNRLFIEIYGLKDELSPDVPLEEVTILQQGEKTIINTSPSNGYEMDESTNYGQRLLIDASKETRLVGLCWNEDNIIQQFISYAIGCYMGRYRLDRPGLHIAHPNPSAEELAPYEVPELVEGSCLASRSPESFSIDEDAIIPILPIDAPFPDNAANRITNFVKLVFGTD